MTTTRFLQLTWISVLLTFNGSCLFAAAGKPNLSPNIIYINADDLGWTDLGYQGSEYYETPNLDKLAKQGMIFSQGYSAASNCAPSRASAMTGQWSPRHGVYTVASSERGNSKDRKLIPTPNTLELAEEHVTMAEALKKNGYVTAHFGKWHLGPDPTTQGFDLNIAGREWGSPYGGGYHSPYEYPNCVQTEEGEYLTDRLGTEAIKFIEANQDKKFFVHFATHSVHTPLEAKEAVIEKYEAKPKTEAHFHPKYAAMVESFDENVGRILDKLDELDLAENTLIVFNSDNGGSWWISKQWPLRAGKGSYYEGGIRVPLVIRWPARIEAGSRSDVPVSNLDFFPTFIEAAGGLLPEGVTLDGDSLMPLLTQQGTFEDRALFWHFPIYLQTGNEETQDKKFRTRPGSVIRQGKWKLIEYFEDETPELYDLEKDPGEKHNLATAQPEQAEALLQVLNNWRQQIGAPVPSELNPEYQP